MERAKERLDDLKEINWDWDSYSNNERSGIRAEARELQRAIIGFRFSGSLTNRLPGWRYAYPGYSLITQPSH